MGRIERISGLLAGIATLLIGVAILTQIVLRMLGVYLPGAVEMATFSMIAAVFLGLPSTYASKGHIRVTLFVGRFKGVLRYRWELASRVLALAWLVYMDYWTIDLVVRSFERGAMTSGLIAIPLWIPQSLIPIGLVLMSVSVLKSIVVLVRRNEDPSAIFND